MTSRMAEPDAAPALPLFGFCEQRRRSTHYQYYTHEEKVARIKLRAYAFLACARRKGYDTFDGATGIGRVVLAFVGPFSWDGIHRRVKARCDRLDAQRAALQALIAESSGGSWQLESDLGAVEDELLRMRTRCLRERMSFMREGSQTFEPKVRSWLDELHAPVRKLMDKEKLCKAARAAHEASPTAATAEALRRAEGAVEAQQAVINDVKAAKAAVKAAMGRDPPLRDPADSS